jgi:hypothetical protein
MTTLTFHIDPKTKKKVQARAKHDGITLTFLLTQFLNAYIQGKFRFGLQTKDEQERLLAEKLQSLARTTDVSTLPSLEEQFADF